MERLVTVSRNILAQQLERPGEEPSFVPMIEIVLVTIDNEYKPQMKPPLVEGGQPQFGLAKVPVTKTIRFYADVQSLQMLIQTVSATLDEISEVSVEEDPHEPGPEPELRHAVADGGVQVPPAGPSGSMILP